MALVRAGQAPVLCGNTTCVGWLALSMCLPSQPRGKSRVRWTLRPRGQIGYCCEVRLVKPVQVHLALALAPPLIAALASPVMIRRNCGMATTLDTAFPCHTREAEAGRICVPML